MQITIPDNVNVSQEYQIETACKLFHKGCQLLRALVTTEGREWVGMRAEYFRELLEALWFFIPYGTDYPGQEEDRELIYRELK